MSESGKPAAMNNDHDHDDRKHWQTPEELRAVESQLASLVPRADRFDREQLIFLAGQASVERPTKRWAWPASLVAMSALAATLLAMLLTQTPSAPPELPLNEKTFAKIRQDFAQQYPRRQRPRGITTATLFREKELAELLNGENRFMANQEPTLSKFTVEPRQHPILTPNSWDQLINDSTL